MVHLEALMFLDLFHVDGRAPTRKLCGSITVPKTTDHSSFLNLIQTLPEVDVLPNYGLPANIDIAIQRDQSQRIISQLKQVVIFHP